MSYLFWIPPLTPEVDPSGPMQPPSDRGHCTPDDFLEQAKASSEAYFGQWPDEPQKVASVKAAAAAIHAAHLLVESGVVGGTFRCHIAGHANPVPGTPGSGWSQDTCTINLHAVQVPAEAPA